MILSEIIIPLEGIIVEQVERQKKVGTMVIPDSADREIANEGIVIAISENVLQGTIKLGTKIIFREFAGESITIEGKKYLVLKKEDILAIYVQQS